jgi:hypothetical protein
MKESKGRTWKIGSVPFGVVVAMLGVAGGGCDEAPVAPKGAPAATNAPVAVVPRGQGLTSTFDVDADGWTIVGDANGAAGIPNGYSLQPYHDVTGGNPGGAIFAVDDGIGLDWYWQAPPKLLGHRPNLYDWTLSFELKVPVSSDYPNRPDVILAGDGLTLVIDAGPNPSPMSWDRFDVRLAADHGWKVTRLDGIDATEAQIRGVLSNLSVLRIRGEYLVGIDTGYLDNVRLHRAR